jgi:hypothetical protein
LSLEEEEPSLDPPPSDPQSSEDPSSSSSSSEKYGTSLNFFLFFLLGSNFFLELFFFFGSESMEGELSLGDSMGRLLLLGSRLLTLGVDSLNGDLLVDSWVDLSVSCLTGANDDGGCGDVGEDFGDAEGGLGLVSVVMLRYAPILG